MKQRLILSGDERVSDSDINFCIKSYSCPRFQNSNPHSIIRICVLAPNPKNGPNPVNNCCWTCLCCKKHTDEDSDCNKSYLTPEFQLLTPIFSSRIWVGAASPNLKMKRRLILSKKKKCWTCLMVARCSYHRWRSFWAHVRSTTRRRKRGNTTGGRGWGWLRMLLLPVLEPWLCTVCTWVSLIVRWDGCGGLSLQIHVCLCLGVSICVCVCVCYRTTADAADPPLWHDVPRGEVQQPWPGGHRPQDPDGHQCHACHRPAVHSYTYQVDEQPRTADQCVRAVPLSRLFIYLCGRFLGTKWMMFLASGIYALFVSTNYWERYYTLVPSAVAIGVAIVPLWASLGNYITR